MSGEARVSGWRVVGVLWRREMVRMVRQPVRIAAAVGTAAMLWLVLGSGFAGSFAAGDGEGRSYAAFLLPGMMTLTAMFTAVFASISLIEDRSGGWLQGVLASPAPRWSIALGKSMGGASSAFIQAAILLPAAWMLGLRPGAPEALLAIGALAITSLALAAVGLALAWRCETTAGYHAAMNLVLAPMWVLSGAFFPAGGATPWLAWLMTVNPLSWCTESIRAPLEGRPATGALALAAAFAAGALALAVWIVSQRSRRII
jgi:ABC-2 type transport system permease protein